jgi:Fe-S oxidoreductase
LGVEGVRKIKAEFLPRMFGEQLVGAFRDFKTIWDPDGRMNPGKIVDPWRPVDNLRLGTHYNPRVVETHFRYPKDSGRFNRAVLRCVGIGNCRQQHGDTMCPSYRATREEMHSTRGRARLLFEMMAGDVLRGGFREPAVKQALDLCLACKGCKGDCPVHVDMATYKAEFLARYYDGRLRPLRGYVLGYLDRWARAATHVPALANALTQTPVAALGRGLLGLARQRPLPRFARRSFQAGFRRHAPPSGPRPDVLLWPDTFNNYFHPQVAHAAVKVLEAAGWRVSVPAQHLCCGRPLYDFGFLDSAKAYLRRVLAVLGEQIDAGTPVVVLEPACASVFRDELGNLFPDDERAMRLAAQTYFFDEFLDRHAPTFRPPAMGRSALVHAHCHRKALLGKNSGSSLLDRCGLTGTVVDSGCCGLAGSFGFEQEKYDVSMQIAELALAPRVREASDDELIVADGFSCREQIAHCTGRTAWHPAQVLALALHAGGETR